MDITTILKDEYGLNNISTTPILHGLIDQNYQVTSTTGQFFFKIFSSISKQAFDQLRRDLLALNKASIPVPVEVIRKNERRSSGSFYALYKFISGEKYNSSIDQMKAVARVFGQVVQAGLPQRSQLSTKNLVDELSNAERKLTTLIWDETLTKEVQQICQEYGQLSKVVKNKIIDPIPIIARGKEIEYRIAYIALCVENSLNGRNLRKDISKLPSIDPENTQYGCAEWFWNRQINSYVVQVEPQRFRRQDRCVVDYHEAVSLEKVRDLFYRELDRVVNKHIS